MYCIWFIAVGADINDVANPEVELNNDNESNVGVYKLRFLFIIVIVLVYPALIAEQSTFHYLVGSAVFYTVKTVSETGNEVPLPVDHERIPNPFVVKNYPAVP